MSKKDAISQIIRDTLDSRGIELTYFDTNACADAVLEYLEEDLELAWRYRELDK